MTRPQNQKRVSLLALFVALVSTAADKNHHHSIFHRDRRHNLFQRFFVSQHNKSRRSQEDLLEQSLRSTTPRYDATDVISKKNKKENEEEGEEAIENSIITTEKQRDSPWSLLTGAIPALFQDPRRLGRLLATSCQIGLIVYLARTIWQAAAEIASELDNISEEEGGGGTPLVNTQQVEQVVSFLQQDPSVMAAKLDAVLQADPSDNSGKQAMASIPPLTLLQLAQKLLVAGLPLRLADSRETQLASVESLLLQLTRSEAKLLQQCLWTPPHPGDDEHELLWDSVAGLQPVKERLMGTLGSVQQRGGTSGASHQQEHHHAYASLFASTPTSRQPAATTGVLLYGPPGCGKTLLVKAMASKARLPCLVIAPSVLLRKYVGDTNLQVRSLFSLASKLAPCIVCIDELDALFRERSDEEHQVSRDLKTEFLQHLDGMLTTTSTDGHRRPPILVVGATNRPFDVDSAVLRRLPQSHFVGMPDVSSRLLLLTQLLRAVPTEPGLDLHQIALRTEGYSPSDIRQVLQTAALSGPMKHNGGGSSSGGKPPRGLSTDDILNAVEIIPPTPLSAQYRAQLTNFARQSSSSMSSSSSSSPSQYSRVTVDDNGLSKWETLHGNFYNIGTLEIDSETFEILSQVAKEIQEDDSDEIDGAFNSDDDGL